MDLGSALLAILIGVVVKGAVMVLGVRLAFRLYRSSYVPHPSRLWLLLPPENVPEIRLLSWSLVLFCISEFTCGIEIYVLFHSSPILSGTHAVVSAAAMGLFALGLLLYFDKKLFHYAEPECLANRICRGCTIQTACKFRVTLLLIATFLAMAAVPPLCASTARMAADTRKWMLPFPGLNQWYDASVVPWLLAHVSGYQPSGAAYFLPHSMLVIEFRLLPFLVIGLSAASIHLLRTGREAAGVRLVVFGIGVLCFSYLELVLYRGTGDVLFGSLAHEVAEFWFLVTTAELLRRAFNPGAA